MTIDRALAERQHDAYAAALGACGLEALVLPADAARFDSVFVEDTGVVWGERALITRMVDAREGEQEAVVEALRGTHEIVRLPHPGARLEGGDVLHTEHVTFVGQSSRTNEAGADALEDFLSEAGRRVERIPVQRCLHLKTGATWIGDETLLVAPALIDPGAFDGFEVIALDEADAGAANAIRLERDVLMAHGRPLARGVLARWCALRGLRLREVEIGEFEKGDGSLTCMSILW